jgi:hypothetical protein
MKFVAMIVLVLGYCPWTLAQDSILTGTERKASLNGYVKVMQGLTIPRSPDTITSLILLHNRINLTVPIASKLDARMEIRNRFFAGDVVQLQPDLARQLDTGTGLLHLSVRWLGSRGAILHSMVDRGYLRFRSVKWDIRVGRQRINWGISNTWNPNDLFNSWNPLDFDYEERAGTDAVRLQYRSGLNDSWEFAYRPGKEPDRHIAAALYKTNRNRFDLQFLAGLWERDWVMGTGWAGQLGTAGFKGECSVYQPRNTGNGSHAVLLLTLMLDRTFPDDWYGSLSFLYNSQPTGMAGPEVLLRPMLSAKELFPFRYSVYAAGQKTFSPVTTMQAGLIYSPERHFLILYPSFAWNAAESLDLDITAQSFFNRDPTRFRMQATAVYVRMKYSF